MIIVEMYKCHCFSVYIANLHDNLCQMLKTNFMSFPNEGLASKALKIVWVVKISCFMQEQTGVNVRWLLFRGLFHCVKSVQIRSFFWSVFSRIRTEYGEIQTRKNSVFGHFLRSVFFHKCKNTVENKLLKTLGVTGSNETGR